MIPDTILFSGERILDLWYLALTQEHGITWTVPKGHAVKIQNKLYGARKEIADDRLDALAIHISADEVTMSMYRKSSREALP
jgi:hypothetical protein